MTVRFEPDRSIIEKRWLWEEAAKEAAERLTRLYSRPVLLEFTLMGFRPFLDEPTRGTRAQGTR